MHGANLTDPTQIVSLQVHDHDMLGALLGIVTQVANDARIILYRHPARAGPLDRAGRDPIPLHQQEPFRGVGQHMEGTTVKVRPEGRGEAGPKAPVEGPGVAQKVSGEALRDVGLINVTRRDVL